MVRIHPEQLITHNVTLVVIIVLSIFFNFYNLDEYPFNPDEAVYSSQAAIWAGYSEYKDNFLLYSRSATNFQLHQIITGAFFRVFGISEFMARTPSAVMGILLIPMIYLIADTLFNRRAALFSALFTGANGYLIHSSRQMHLDTILVFFMVLSVLCLVKWRKTKKDWLFYSFLASTMLMVMAKIILIIPFVFLLLVYLHMESKLKPAIRMLLKPQSVLITLAAMSFMLYYIISIVGLENYIATFIYATGRESRQSPLFYINTMTLFIGYIFLSIAAIGMVQALRERNKEGIFCLLWFAFIIIFFTYYPLQGYNYLLPVVPAISLLSGRAFESLTHGFRTSVIVVFLAIIIPLNAYPALSYPYGTLSDPDYITPDILTRFNPVKYIALRDAALWMKENVDPNSTVVTYTFADHHNVAFYSNLKTYTIKNYPGFYMPVDGTAKIIWDVDDTFELIKKGDVDYIVYMREKGLEKNLTMLNVSERMEFIPVYQNSYKTPEWYSNGNLSISILKLKKNLPFKADKIDNSSFTIVALPDTQAYTSEKLYILDNQVQWILANKDNLNIRFVIHSGDIVEVGNKIIQWDRVNGSIGKLDGKIPYLVVPGNHDYNGPVGSRNTTSYNSYFNYTRFEKYSWYGGHYPSSNGNNNYGFFSSPDGDFMTMGLDFCPTDDVLDWANNTINSYHDKKVILFTHSYLNIRGERIASGEPNSCNYMGAGGNEGDDIYNKLVKQHPNIVLIISGHKVGIAKRTDYVNNYPINQMLQNAESTTGENGFLWTYTFIPSEKRIDVRTYAPYLNKYDTAADAQFNFTYKNPDYPAGSENKT